MAMDEYIKREDALRQVLMVETRENMYKCMKNIPAADVVERKIGKWVHDQCDNHFICSACGHKIFKKPTNYCSSCGAVMVWYERRANDV